MTLTFHKTIKKEVENQNDDINRQVDSAKSDIKNKKDTQSQIDKLQNQIDQLKQMKKLMRILNSQNFIKTKSTN